MVSPLTATSTSPNRTISLLPVTKGAGEIVLPAVSVSKRNTASAPQLHSVSFGDFRDVLASALWHGSANQDFDQLIGEMRKPDTSVRLSQATKQLPQSETDAPLTNVDASEKAKRPDADDAKRMNGAIDRSASSKRAALPDLPLGRAITSVDAREKPSQAPPPTPIEGVGYVPDTSDVERVAGPARSSNHTPDNSAPVERLNAGSQMTAGQVQDAAVDRVPTSQEESEVFRIDLHPDASLMQGSFLTSSSNADVKGSTEASGAQTAVAASMSVQTQASRVSSDMEGTLPEPSNQPKHTPAASSSENVAKCRPEPEATLSSKKQLADGSSELNKPSEKTGGDLAADILNHAGAPPAAIFAAPARTEARVQQLGSAASAEVSKMTDAPALTQTKEMVVRVEGAGGAAVNVRLLDLGEQVQVAVRSADPFTAAQLRQDLTSLASNLDRIGWRTDAAASASSQSFTLHETSQADRDSDSSNAGSTLDWDDTPGQRKNTSPELWDIFLASQDS